MTNMDLAFSWIHASHGQLLALLSLFADRGSRWLGPSRDGTIVGECRAIVEMF